MTLAKQEIKKIKTDSGIRVKRIFSSKDLVDKTFDNEEAGRYPYTRGLYPNMYRERLWTMRQYSGFGSAEETNKRFRFLLDHGQTGLSLSSIFQRKLEEIPITHIHRAKLEEPELRLVLLTI